MGVRLETTCRLAMGGEWPLTVFVCGGVPGVQLQSSIGATHISDEKHLSCAATGGVSGAGATDTSASFTGVETQHGAQWRVAL